MSGKVVEQAVIPHECSPGWTWKPISEDDEMFSIFGGKGGSYGVPPTPSEFPAGTVWECDCGRFWVSKGQQYSSNRAGWLEWRRESRRERRRRLGLRWWQREGNR